MEGEVQEEKEDEEKKEEIFEEAGARTENLPIWTNLYF